MVDPLSPYAARPANSKSVILRLKGAQNRVTNQCHLAFGKWHAYHNTLPACPHGEHCPCFRTSDHLTSWPVMHQLKQFLKIYKTRQVCCAFMDRISQEHKPFMSKLVLLLTGCATSCSRWPRPEPGSSISLTSNPFCRKTSIFSVASSSSAAVSSKGCGLTLINIPHLTNSPNADRPEKLLRLDPRSLL